jgi:hypothetical protein
MCVYIYIYTRIYAYMTHVHISMYTWFVSISMYICNHHDVDAYSIGLKIGPFLLNHMGFVETKWIWIKPYHVAFHPTHIANIFIFSCRVMPQEQGGARLFLDHSTLRALPLCKALAKFYFIFFPFFPPW